MYVCTASVGLQIDFHSTGIRDSLTTYGCLLLETFIESNTCSMSSAAVDLSIRGTVPPSQWEHYEPSATSSTASSQRSVFSDTGSALSSTASSIFDEFRPSQEGGSRLQASTTDIAAHIEKIQQQQQAIFAEHERWVQPYASTSSVPPAQRQHPRRSNSNQKPPPLVRQCERKVAFVDNLVGKHIYVFHDV